MSGRIDLKSVRLKTAQKYSNWLLFYLFFQKQAPFSVLSLKGKEGRVGFRKKVRKVSVPVRGTERVVKTIEGRFSKKPLSAMKARFQIAECSSLYQQRRTG